MVYLHCNEPNKFWFNKTQDAKLLWLLCEACMSKRNFVYGGKPANVCLTQKNNGDV